MGDFGSTEPASVRIIADEFLPGTAPRHHVRDRNLGTDPKSSWRVPGLAARQTDRPAENKNQCLTPRRHRDTAKPPAASALVVGALELGSIARTILSFLDDTVECLILLAVS